MRGGEILNFRQFLLSSLVVGAAMLVPDIAFAEKPNGVQQPQKAAIQVNTSVKTNSVQASSSGKGKLANETGRAPDKWEVVGQQELVKEQPSKGQSRSQAVSEKATEALKSLPEQAKGTVQTAVKKTELAHDADKAAKGNESSKQPSPKKANEYSKTETEVSREPQKTGQTEFNSSTQDKVTEPVHEGKRPVTREKLPDVSQMSNQTQRISHSGGHSNDRVHSGFITFSWVDKWFEWNTSYEIQLVQPYLSRLSLLNNQWVNAPPSPPPQRALLLKV
jgi:hypothetical protein